MTELSVKIDLNTLMSPKIAINGIFWYVFYSVISILLEYIFFQ